MSSFNSVHYVSTRYDRFKEELGCLLTWSPWDSPAFCEWNKIKQRIRKFAKLYNTISFFQPNTSASSKCGNVLRAGHARSMWAHARSVWARGAQCRRIHTCICTGMCMSHERAQTHARKHTRACLWWDIPLALTTGSIVCVSYSYIFQGCIYTKTSGKYWWWHVCEFIWLKLVKVCSN